MGLKFISSWQKPREIRSNWMQRTRQLSGRPLPKHLHKRLPGAVFFQLDWSTRYCYTIQQNQFYEELRWSPFKELMNQSHVKIGVCWNHQTPHNHRGRGACLRFSEDDIHKHSLPVLIPKQSWNMRSQESNPPAGHRKNTQRPELLE